MPGLTTAPECHAANPKLRACMFPEVQRVTTVAYDGSCNAEGLYDGKGSCTFISGNRYTGSFQLGLMHGHGRYEWPHGLVYEGQFDCNRASGTGTLAWASGATYSGQVLDGRRHGRGTMRFAGSAAVYEGEWRHGKRHGQGRLSFDDASLQFYEGAWEADVKQGFGVMHYATGGVYAGQWADDLKHGFGLMRWSGGREQYRGEWAQGLQHGQGEHVWLTPLPQGGQGRPGRGGRAFFLMHNRYQGEFIHGRRHGYGTLHYATGAVYEGQWCEELKHGRGVFAFENGSIWEGEWQRDRPVLADGQTFAPAPGGLVQLRIADLLATVEEPQAALRAVSYLLLREAGELRQMYEAYSCTPPPNHHEQLSQQGLQHSYALTLAQYWALLHDARVPAADCGLAAIDRSVQQALQPPREVAAQRAQHGVAAATAAAALPLHAPSQRLLFRDFCEALVRTAARKFPDLPSLEARVQALLQRHVLPLAAAEAARRSVSPQVAAEAATAPGSACAALQAAHPLLQQLFLRAAGLSQLADSVAAGSAGPAQQELQAGGHAEPAEPELQMLGQWPDEVPTAAAVACSNTSVTVRSVLQQMQEQGLLTEQLPVEAAAAILHRAAGVTDTASQQGLLLLDNELIWPEFQQAMVQSALEASPTSEAGLKQQLQALLQSAE